MTHPVHGTLLGLGAVPLDTVHGGFTAHVFHDLAAHEPAVVVTRGDVGAAAPLPARVHSSCVTSEAYGACDCDCAEQLDAALAHIARAGRGAVFYLVQEGRGAGFAAKARDRMLVQASGQRLTTFDAYAHLGLARDARRYGAVAAACRLLGIRAPLRLLTNNPEKRATLAADGVVVDGAAPLAAAPSPWNRHYLAAKSGSGHTLPATGGGGDALPPEPVEAFAPHVLAAAPRFVRLASYLVPLRVAGLPWFRLHAYLDLVARRERVVLTYERAGDGRAPLVRVQPEVLLERFPLRAPVRRARWLAAAAEIVRDGAGCVAFVHASDPLPAATDGAVADDGVLDLLAAHVGARPARLLVDDPADAPPLAAALVRRGVAADETVVLATA